jgi:hypothetical protein
MAETTSPMNVQTMSSPLKQALIEKLAVPVCFIALGYAIGYFQGNSRGKRKAAQAS